MEKLLLIVVAIVLLAIAALFFLGFRSQSGEPPGLVEGRLKPCPDTPNCVNSEFAMDTGHFLEPLAFDADRAAAVLPVLKTIIVDMGGRIRVEEHGYLAATFTSSLFRFVDDLEVRVDADAGVIHLRSASRVGRNDLGANRARVERLRRLFHVQAG